MKLSIIIPCYNEASTIKKIIKKINLQADIDKEIIVVDDCSTDKTRLIIENELKDKIKNQFVICIPENIDRYKRIIAECFLKQESISSFMVRNGYAFDYVKYSKGKYQSEQNFAKENKLGLWAMKFEYPWSWRKINK